MDSVMLMPNRHRNEEWVVYPTTGYIDTETPLMNRKC
jgi:hypothetical protein